MTVFDGQEPTGIAADGRDFQPTYFDDRLRWTGVDDNSAIRYHPTLTGDADAAMAAARSAAREAAVRSAQPAAVVA